MKRFFFFPKFFFLLFLVLNFSLANHLFAQTIPISGDIVFTEFQTDNDVVEFITLKRLDLRNLGLTDNGILKSGAFRTGEGIFAIPNTSSLSDVPAGTFVRLVSIAGTNDVDPSDGIIVLNGTGFDLSTSGDQIIAYTGTSANPVFIAGINGGDSGGWNNGATSDKNSKAPGTLSDIDVSATKNNDNARLLLSVAVSGNVSTIRNSIKTTSNWEKSDNAFANFNSKNILFNESNYASGTIVFSSVTSSNISLNLSGLNFNNSNADTRYMVVIAAGSAPTNAVDRFTCYSGISTNFPASVSAITAFGTPPCINPTPGNGKVVYFNYGLPAALLITGLAANTNYYVKIIAVNGNGYSANLSSTPSSGNQATLSCASSTISYSGSPFCNSIITAQLPMITGTSGGVFSYSGVGVLNINTNTGAITASGSTPGTYTVHYQIAASGQCSAVDATASVTIAAVATVNITGSTSICVDGTTTLSPTAGGTWTSNNPSVASVTNTGIVTGLSAGNATFTFVSSTAPNCSSTTSAVQVNSVPTGALAATENSGTSNDNKICAGANVNFTATAGYSNYKFILNGTTILQNGASNTFNSTSLAGNSSVTVEVTSAGGCKSVFNSVAIDVNAAPTVVNSINDVNTMEDDAARSIDISTVFSDPDADPLTIEVSSSNSGLVNASYSTVTGVILMFGHNANGLATVTVTAKDPCGAMVSDQFVVNVGAVNDAPVTRDSTISGNEDASSITGAVVASDAEGDILTYSLVSSVDASKGSLSFNSNGSYSFVPALNFNGTASFSYKVYDGQLYSNVATVTITVTPVNDAPVVVYYNNNYTVPEDFGILSINLSNTFQDVDGDALTITAGTGFYPIAFTYYNSATKELQIYFMGNANGFAIIPVIASDGSASVNYYINIMVLPVNDAPSGTSKTVTTNQNVAYTFTQSDFGFSDPYDYPSNNFKAVKLTTLPSGGNLILNGIPITVAGTNVNIADINAGNLKFQPALNGSGSPYSSFTFQVQDDGGVDVYYAGGIDLDPIAKTMTINVTTGSNFTSSQTLRENISSATPSEEFKVQVYPTPTTSQFKVKIESPDSQTAIMLKVIDLSGRIIEMKRGLTAGQTFQLGAAYKPGMYIIELIQGNKKKTTKVVKQSD